MCKKNGSSGGDMILGDKSVLRYITSRISVVLPVSQVSVQIVIKSRFEIVLPSCFHCRDEKHIPYRRRRKNHFQLGDGIHENFFLGESSKSQAGNIWLVTNL